MKGSKPMRNGSGNIAGPGNLGRERGHDNVGPNGYSKKCSHGCYGRPGHNMKGGKSKK